MRKSQAGTTISQKQTRLKTNDSSPLPGDRERKKMTPLTDHIMSWTDSGADKEEVHA